MMNNITSDSEYNRISREWSKTSSEIDKIKRSAEVLEKEEGKLKDDLTHVERELSKVQAEKEMILKKMGIVTGKLQPYKEQLRKEELELSKLTEEKHKRENELRHEQK